MYIAQKNYEVEEQISSGGTFCIYEIIVYGYDMHILFMII